MPRACSICSHPEQASITRDLADSISYRAIAEAYGVSKSALARHREHLPPPPVQVVGHVPPPVTPPRPALAPETARALREELDQLKRVIDDDPRARYSERYLRYTLSLLEKLIGALSPGSA